MTPALFKRHGTEPFTGRVQTDDRGRPFYFQTERCHRCGGAGGADKWKQTGWTCYQCGGNGQGPTVREPLYTADQVAKLNAAADKRAAKKAAAAAAAEEQRRAPFNAWAKEHEHILAQIHAHGQGDLVQRIDNDALHFIIPQDWMLDSAIASILRRFAVDDQRASSTHIGAIGERVEIDLVCERVLNYGDRYRPFYICIMRDHAGNRVIYKGARPPLAEDDECKVRATVKAHEDRNGERQTVIERVKSI